MKYGLYIFVEGNDDLRFMEKIIKPFFEKNFKFINIITYKQERKNKIDGYLKSIKSIKDKYLFISDLNSSPCFSDRKQKLLSIYNELDYDKIIIAKKEIESWYLAGINKENCMKLKIKYLNNTDDVSKEQFQLIFMPKKYDSKYSFMLDILSIYNLNEAINRNKSLNYFYSKINNTK